MTDKSPERTAGDSTATEIGLAKPILDGLGEELRRADSKRAPKPAYLGDRALPPEIEHRLVELENAVDIHEKGVDAVGKALGIEDSETTADETPPTPQAR